MQPGLAWAEEKLPGKIKCCKEDRIGKLWHSSASKNRSSAPRKSKSTRRPRGGEKSEAALLKSKSGWLRKRRRAKSSKNLTSGKLSCRSKKRARTLI